MAPRKEWPAFVYVAVGLLAGAAYVAFDLVSEAKLRQGTLTGTLASAHSLVDHLIPLLAGALMGLSVYHVRLRKRLAAAEEAAERAEALRVRLLRVERDQAVWVLAAAVLHELNNPLHALGLLLDEYQGSVDAAQRADLLERAHAQVRRALAHLETLRSMHGNGEPDEQRVSLGDVLSSVAADVSALAASDGVTVHAHCDERVMVRADPSYLRAILENLLDNSLHSLRSASGGTVTLKLTTSAGRAVVSVADDGPALDPAVRGTLFDPLRTTKRHGLGLGLPIARALARAMHGDLLLEEGAQKAFRLELPLGERA